MPGITVTTPDPLDVLEAQIEELEKTIIGEAVVNERDTPLAESLIHSNNAINNAIANYSSIKTMFDRLNQLGLFVDPSYDDHLISRTSKVRTVLESEFELYQLLEQLKELNNLNNSISGETFRCIPELNKKLTIVGESTLKLEEQIKELTVKAKTLVEKYESVIRPLNQALLHFDNVLTEIEENEKPVKIDD